MDENSTEGGAYEQLDPHTKGLLTSDIGHLRGQCNHVREVFSEGIPEHPGPSDVTAFLEKSNSWLDMLHTAIKALSDEAGLNSDLERANLLIDEAEYFTGELENFLNKATGGHFDIYPVAKFRLELGKQRMNVAKNLLESANSRPSNSEDLAATSKIRDKIAGQTRHVEPTDSMSGTNQLFEYENGEFESFQEVHGVVMERAISKVADKIRVGTDGNGHEYLYHEDNPSKPLTKINADGKYVVVGMMFYPKGVKERVEEGAEVYKGQFGRIIEGGSEEEARFVNGEKIDEGVVNYDDDDFAGTLVQEGATFYLEHPEKGRREITGQIEGGDQHLGKILYASCVEQTAGSGTLSARDPLPYLEWLDNG